MPALKPTEHVATIRWLGRVPDRATSLVAIPIQSAQLSFGGFQGEAHAGLTRPSCSRVRALHAVGTEIANTRQLSIVSVEELEAIAHAMGIDRLAPSLVGASMMLEGLPDFTHLPPSSRLQSEDGATLVVDMENRSCHLPAAPINEEGPGNGDLFRAAANGRRGVTAWVERQGELRVGGTMRLFVPDQPTWQNA
ncbi:MAG: sulfurase [Pseudomonadota bacterium]